MDLGEHAINCNKPRSYIQYTGVEKRFLETEECNWMKWSSRKFQVLTAEKSFFELLTLNAVETSVECSITIQQEQNTQCHAADKFPVHINDNPDHFISGCLYKSDQFVCTNWDVNAEKLFIAYSLAEPVSNKTLSLGTYFVNLNRSDVLSIQVDCDMYFLSLPETFMRPIKSFGVIPTIHNVSNQNFFGISDWWPYPFINLRLQSFRIFSHSSVFLKLRWHCPIWEQPSAVFQLKCVFFHDQEMTEGCSNCLHSIRETNCSKCSVVFDDIQSSYGPIFTTEVEWNETEVWLVLVTNLETRIYPNGSLQIHGSPENLPHILEYNYFSGNPSYTKRTFQTEGNAAQHYISDEHEEFRYPYLEDAILLPGTYETPRMVLDKALHNMNAVCKLRQKSAAGRLSNWSNVYKFQFKDAEILDTKLLVSTQYSAPGTSYSYHTSFSILEDDGGTWRSIWDTIRDLNLVEETSGLVDTSQDGIIQILGDCRTKGSWLCPKSSRKKLKHVPKIYKRRRVGCHHWMFRMWYAFIFDQTTENYFLAYASDELSISEALFWDDHDWAHGVEVDGYPVSIKCPHLHSFLLWSGIDSKGDVFFNSIGLNARTGEPQGNVNSGWINLCACSNVTRPSIPVVDIRYADLNDARSFEFLVNCGMSICGTVLNSGQIRRAAVFEEILWFGTDHTDQYYSIDSGTKTLRRNSLEHIGYQSFPAVHQKDLLSTSVTVLNEAEHIPIPPAHCILPTITNIGLQMVSKSTGHLTVVLEWKDHEKETCQELAVPEIILTVQYSNKLQDVFDTANNQSELLFCHDSDAYLQTNISLFCTKILTKPFRANHYSFENTVKTLVLGNLMPHIWEPHIFVQVTARLGMAPKTVQLWYSGLKWPSAKMILDTKYIPPSSTSTILGIVIPVICVAGLIVGISLWMYNRSLYMYRYLKRLAATDIKRQDKLGEGKFGEVFKANLANNGIIVVKMLKESATDREEKEFREEALLLSKFQSPFVVKPIGICLQSRPIMLALEFIDGGSLNSYLKRPEVRADIAPADLLLIIKSVLNGCIYLESEGYIHRDIAARNCLVSLSSNSWKPSTAKLSDFGLAKDVGEKAVYRSRSVDKYIPVAWTSPEAFSGTFSSKSDVWAFGVLMWEVFSFSATPYSICSFGGSHVCPMETIGLDKVEYNVCVKNLNLSAIPSPCTGAFCSSLSELFNHCWRYDPEQRPSFQQLKSFLKIAQADILSIEFPDFSQDRPCLTDLIVHDAECGPSHQDSVAALMPVYSDTRSQFTPAYQLTSFSASAEFRVPSDESSILQEDT